MKKLVKISALTIAFSLIMNIAAFAYKTEPGGPGEVGQTQAQLNGYSEEEWSRLMDNTLEYSEIPALVHTFNASMDNAWKSFNDGVETLQLSKNAAKDVVDEVQEAYDQIEKTAGKEAAEAMLGPSLRQAKSTQSMVNKTYRNMTKETSSAIGGIEFAEKQVVSAVEQILVGYKTIVAQKATLNTLVSLYQESYNANLALLSQGMATSEDLLAAQTNLLSAQSSVATLEVTERQLYNQLITMCGWKPDAAVVIGEVPNPDMNVIAGYNPDVDMSRAEGNNPTLKALRKGEKPKKTTAKEAYLENEDQLKSILRANVTESYNEVIAAKGSYEASAVGAQAASALQKASNAQYSQGLVSKAQYIGTSISAVQKNASAEAARLNLIGKMLAYESALNGNSSVE